MVKSLALYLNVRFRADQDVLIKLIYSKTVPLSRYDSGVHSLALPILPLNLRNPMSPVSCKYYQHLGGGKGLNKYILIEKPRE